MSPAKRPSVDQRGQDQLLKRLRNDGDFRAGAAAAAGTSQAGREQADRLQRESVKQVESMQQQLQQLQLEVQEKAAENVTLKAQHAQTEQETKTARDQLETRVRELEAEQQRRRNESAEQVDIVVDEISAGRHLCFERLRSDPSLRKQARALTGFPSADACIKFYAVCNVGKRAETMRLWRGPTELARRKEGQKPKSGSSPQASVSPQDGYLYTLVILRTGISFSVAEALTGVDAKTISLHFVTWVNYLKRVLHKIMPYPSREMIQACMGPRWESVYRTKNVRLILDATELTMQKPYSLEVGRACWSSYKVRAIRESLSARVERAGFDYAV
jgi:hypothetical protein